MRGIHAAIFVAGAVVALAGVCRGATLTVDARGLAQYAKIHHAIAAARDGDTVLVRAGEYVLAEPLSFLGKAIVVRAETDDPALTVVRMSDTPLYPHRRSVVVFERAEPSGAVLAGFTLTGGGGTDLPATAGGGVMVGEDAAPEIRNCAIAANAAAYGGGVYCAAYSAPRLVDCRIEGNRADERGGGVCSAEDAAPSFLRCRIAGNDALWGGGASCDAGSTTAFDECALERNTAQAVGGVLALQATVVLRDCAIIGNRGRARESTYPPPAGGVLCGTDAAVELERCVLARNASLDGGGVQNYAGNLRMSACTIADNVAWKNGGGVEAESGVTLLTHCTITGNTAARGGGIRVRIAAALESCIVWGNGGGSYVAEAAVAHLVKRSCVETEAVLPGTGNSNADPRFCGWGARDEVYVDASAPAPGDGSAAHPYRDLASALEFSTALSADSPCIGAGESGSTMGATAETCGLPGAARRLVRIAAGTYQVTDVLSVAHPVRIVGAGADLTLLRGTVQGLRTGDSLEDLAIAGVEGEALRVVAGESPEVARCVFRGDVARALGAAACGESSSPLFTDCSFLEGGSYSYNGAGLYCERAAKPRLQGCLLADSVYGLYCAYLSEATLTDCRIERNLRRGVACVSSAALTMTRCVLERNEGSPDDGAAGAADLEDCARADFADCVFSANRAAQGGGLRVTKGGKIAVTGGSFLQNAADEGGGIYGDGTAVVTLTGVTFAQNTARNGAALLCEGGTLVSANGCTFVGNAATGVAGAIYFTAVGLTLSECLVAGNAAVGDGGGLYIYLNYRSAITLSECVLSDNESGSRGGGLVWSAQGPVGVMRHCTVTGNVGRITGGVHCTNASPAIESCILFDNAGTSLRTEGTAAPVVTYSCVERDAVWPGQGNINDTPCWIGWGGRPEAFVDAGHPDPGDGSAAHPYADLDQALAYDLALARESPCVGRGLGGSTMGAATGVADGAWSSTRVLRVAAGSYAVRAPGLVHRASLEGAGRDLVTLAGRVAGLRTGAALANVRIASDAADGISIAADEAPEVRACAIAAAQNGVYCGPGSRPVLEDCALGAAGTGGLRGVYCDTYAAPAIKRSTIAGHRTRQDAYTYGGGVFCAAYAAPALEACAIEGNTASEGAGVYVSVNATCALTACALAGNVTSPLATGGGLSVSGSASLTGCAITGSVAGSGAGMYVGAAASAVVRDSTIAGNFARGSVGSGGGVCAEAGSSLALERCRIERNESRNGAGVYCRGALVLTGTTIARNTAAAKGGGLSCAAVEATDCVITGNAAADRGGGVLQTAGAATWRHATIAINSADAGGGIYVEGGTPVLADSILWGNAGASVTLAAAAGLDARYSCIEGAAPWPGVGNANQDPRFCGQGDARDIYVDAAHAGQGDGSVGNPFATIGEGTEYRLALAADSQCIGAAEGGATMGADTGRCDAAAGERGATVHVAAGTYAEKIVLPPGAALQGSGESATEIAGAIFGPRSGGFIADLTVRIAAGTGISVIDAERVEIRRCTLEDTADSSNGIVCTRSAVAVVGCTVEGFNRGLNCTDAALAASDCVLSGNSTGLSLNKGSGTVTRCVISGNRFGVGLTSASPAFDDCAIADNSDGGLSSTNGAPRLAGCTITRNRSWKNGGGLLYTGTGGGSVERCTITENSAQERGGGVYVEGSAAPVLRKCAITLNRAATYSGGGLYSAGTAVPQLVNCLIAGNSSAMRGGGVDTHSPIALVNCTLAGNSANTGAGLCSYAGAANLTNCLLWDNRGAALALEGGGTAAVAYSCVQSAAVWPGTGNTNADPLLVRPCAWVDPGTPAAPNDDLWVQGDYRVREGSSCIDKGTAEGAPADDLLGAARPAGAGFDIGAYEYGGPVEAAVYFRRGDANADGRTDLSDAVFVLRYLFGGAGAPTCAKAADVNDDGTLTIADSVFVLSFLFAHGTRPPYPSSVCGGDQTQDALSCERYEPCAARRR